MGRYALVALVMLAAVAMVWAEETAKPAGGELNGTVVTVEPVKAEAVVRLALTITTETGAKETFVVGPANEKAYALVGTLKAGEKVRLGWVTERDQKFIRVIRRLE